MVGSDVLVNYVCGFCLRFFVFGGGGGRGKMLVGMYIGYGVGFFLGVWFLVM